MEELNEFEFAEVMQRVKSAEDDQAKAAEGARAAVIASYAPQLADLRRSETELVELTPEVKRVQGQVEKFPWHMVRERGKPVEIGEAMGEARRCTSLGLAGIRKAIQTIESFSADDVNTNWRPARDVGALVANAGHARQNLGFVKRQLHYWGARLAEKLPPVGYGQEAVEGERPPEPPDDGITVISNMAR
jgi:hypothetical protein